MNFHSVKGLSERRRLPRLGKVRGGILVTEKTKGGKEVSYPKEVDYFVAPPEVQAVYGQAPRELDVMFPCEEREIFFPQAFKWWGQLGLKCRGNGEIGVKRVGDLLPEEKETLDEIPKDPNSLVEVACPCSRLKTECGLSGRLFLILPRVSMGGVYEFPTGSPQNVITVNSYIDYLRALFATERSPQGRISWIPLKLRKIPQELSYLEGETRRTRVHYLWQFELPFSMRDIFGLRKDPTFFPEEFLVEAPKEKREFQPREAQQVEPQEKREEEAERKRLLAKIHIMKEKLVKLIELDENWWKDHLLAKWGRSSSAELELAEPKEELAFLSNEVNVALKMTAEGHQSRETEN